ncbi:hypothetical protein PPNK14_41550 [Pectobacterium parmentieri]
MYVANGALSSVHPPLRECGSFSYLTLSVQTEKQAAQTEKRAAQTKNYPIRFSITPIVLINLTDALTRAVYEKPLRVIL